MWFLRNKSLDNYVGNKKGAPAQQHATLTVVFSENFSRNKKTLHEKMSKLGKDTWNLAPELFVAAGVG